MRFLLAAYDPAHETPDGSYWVWAHPDLPADVRNSFYYEIAARNLPEKPNELLADDCHGGWAAINDTWACWYRFLDGGRDLRGRPGRFVLICAFCGRRDNANTNGFGVLESPPFQNMVKVAAFARPLPPPDSLDLSLDLPECTAPVASPVGNVTGKVDYAGEDADEKASAACANLPPELRFTCAIRRHQGMTAITVETSRFRDGAEPPDSRIAAMVPIGTPRSTVRNPQSPATTGRVDGDRRWSGLLRVAVPLWQAALCACFALALGFVIGERFGMQPVPIEPIYTPDTRPTELPGDNRRLIRPRISNPRTLSEPAGNEKAMGSQSH